MKVISFGPLNTKVVNIIRQNSLRLQLSTRDQQGDLNHAPFNLTASVLRLGSCEALHSPFQSGASVSDCPLALLFLSFVGLQSQTF